MSMADNLAGKTAKSAKTGELTLRRGTPPAGFVHSMNASEHSLLALARAQDRGRILVAACAGTAMYLSDEAAILAHRSGAPIVAAELVRR
jgi:hypothetical protein